MELHHKQLEEIRESKQNKLKDIAKSTDQQMKKMQIWKIINSGFRESGKLFIAY
jgi:DNA anti-recombination protein RmuC